MSNNTSKAAKRKILLIENSGADFYGSRLPFALYLKRNDYEVSALVPDDGYIELIENSGINVLHYPIRRGDKGLKQLVRLIFLYRRTIKDYSFDLVHSFRFQPNLITSISVLFLQVRIILHITGLGIAYSNRSFKYQFLRLVSQMIYFVKFCIADLLILQNPDDIKSLWFTKIKKNKIRLILGSGINTSQYTKKQMVRESLRESNGILADDILFIFITRLIWEKGIAELTDAFKNILKDYPAAKLFIVGAADKDNPRHVSDEFIHRFAQSKNIRFLGKSDEVKNLLTSADVFIYPSYYREGIPRAILEALAMSLPIITTNMPGCRLTVEDGKNGYLIAPRSVVEIERSVIKILSGKNELNKMGRKSRDMAENYFSDHIIYKEMLHAYQSVLD